MLSESTCGIVDIFWSHNSPFFQCNIANTNFLISNTCKIRFHDVIYCTVHTCMLHYDVILRKKSKTWPNEYVLDPYLYNLFRWIQLCDKMNLTFVDCCDKILLNSS